MQAIRPQTPILLSRRVGANPITNLSVLQDTEYLGRMIIAGINTAGNLVLCYGLTGRSANSKNRRILNEDGRLHTDFADKTAGGDPALVIYDVALWAPDGRLYTMSNGAQTTSVHEYMVVDGGSFLAGLEPFEHEPDAPNFTPRITAQIDLAGEKPVGNFSSIRRSLSGDGHNKEFWSFLFSENGFGRCITTYDGNAPEDDPIPLFRGAPFLVPLAGSAGEIAQTYWEALNKDFRVSTAVIEIEATTGDVIDVQVINLHGDGE